MTAHTKKSPLITEPNPTTLINMDPVAAARSIAASVCEKSGEKDWLDERVYIQFYNIEEPNNQDKCTFMYGPCTDPKKIEIAPGEIKELTRADIRFIESRQTAIYDYRHNSQGKRVKTFVGWKPRFQCRQVNIRMPK